MPAGAFCAFSACLSLVRYFYAFWEHAVLKSFRFRKSADMSATVLYFQRAVELERDALHAFRRQQTYLLESQPSRSVTSRGKETKYVLKIVKKFIKIHKNLSVQRNDTLSLVFPMLTIGE